MTPEKTQSPAEIPTSTGLGAVVDFIGARLAEAEKALKGREQMEYCWRGGTDESWRAVGCHMSKAQRIRASLTQARIGTKKRHEVEMYRATLSYLQAPNNPAEHSPKHD